MNDRQLSIAQICLANAQRDEKSKDFRFGVRLPHYQRLIRDVRASIFCIKELRLCAAPPGHVPPLLMPHEILKELFKDEVDYAQAFCFAEKVHETKGKDSYKPMYMAQVYDARRWRCLDVGVEYLYPKLWGDNNEPTFGGSKMWAEYCPNTAEGFPDHTRKFRVESYHFPMESSQRTDMCKELQSSQHAALHSTPTIRIGDFNLFRDDPLYETHKQMLGQEFEDVSTPLLRSAQTGNPLYGTFYPFPHDKPPVPIALPTEKSPHNSLLDYAWLGKAPIYRSLLQPMSCALYEPSDYAHPEWDHLPMLLVMKFLY